MIRKRWREKKHSGPLTLKGRTTKSEDYAPSCGRCSIPNWKACGCSALGKRNENSIVAIESQMSPSVGPGFAERVNAEADERLQLALLD